MRVLFLGTPEFAATILGRLLESRHEVVGVVTQPPRQAGRGLGTSDPPAARLARERGIPVFQPENLYDAEVLAQLVALAPDLGVTAAFGRILKKSLLELPAKGIWNVHTSLLPRHRGAAPVPAAILAGDRQTGVTLFQLDRGMDTGALLLQSMTAIGPKETAGALTMRLAALGGDLLVEGIDREDREPLLRRPQPVDGVSYAPPLEKEDGRIDWRRPAEQIDRWIRAVMPWPGAFTYFGPARVAILEGEPLHEMPSEVAPGTVVAIRNGLEIACLPGVLRLQTVQQEGRKAQPADVWARGARIAVGDLLSCHPLPPVTPISTDLRASEDR